MTLYEETVAAINRVQGGIPAGTLSTRLRFGEHRSVYHDSGQDFYQVREYDPDRDPVNRINWSRAEPSGELYVRELIEEREIPLVFLADLSSSLDFGIRGVFPKRKLLLETLGILGLTAQHDQDRAGLVGFADDVIISEPPRGGAGHVYLMLRELAQFFEAASPEIRRKTDFAKAFRHLRERYRGSALIAVLSDCAGSEAAELPALLKDRNPRHEIVFFILDDLREFDVRGWGTLKIQDMETGAIASISMRKMRAWRREVEAAREALRKELRAMGIDSAVLTYGSHFAQLTKFFSERKEGL